MIWGGLCSPLQHVLYVQELWGRKKHVWLRGNCVMRNNTAQRLKEGFCHGGLTDVTGFSTCECDNRNVGLEWYNLLCLFAGSEKVILSINWFQIPLPLPPVVTCVCSVCVEVMSGRNEDECAHHVITCLFIVLELGHVSPTGLCYPLACH